MKKKVIIFIFLGILFICSLVFVFGGGSALDFRANCASSGCYIYDCQYPDGPPLDVLSELDNNESGKCNVNYFCDNNVLKKRVTSTPYTGPRHGSYRDCVNQLINSCTYTLETCEYVCVEENGNAYCSGPCLTCNDYYNEGHCGGDLDDGCGEIINCEPTLSNTICDPEGNLVCDSGFENCDNNWLTGCETNINNDFNNCGGCGIECLENYDCVNGICARNLWKDMSNNIISSAPLGGSVKLWSPYANEGTRYRIYDGENVFIEEHLLGNISFNNKPNTGFRFNVIGIEEIGRRNLKSPELSITESIFDPMIVEIIEPKCGSYYNKTETVNVKINLSSRFKLITGDVTINNGEPIYINNFESNIVEFEHKFDESGNIGIVVNAKSSAGERFRSISNIMIIDNSSSGPDYYVASCIDSPKNFQRFSTPSVDFNAESSIGIKWNGTDAIELEKKDLFFNWNFYSNDKLISSCSGTGDKKCPGAPDGTTVYNFTRHFARIGNNKATLSVSIAEGS